MKSRKTLYAVARLMLFIALLVALLNHHSEVRADGGDGASPVVEVQEPNFDFGQVFAGQVVSHAFKVKNTGSGVLNLAFKDAQTPGSMLVKPASSLVLQQPYVKWVLIPAAYTPGPTARAVPAAAPI
jgi:HYDIN/CFA65/VesB family protein